jgi:hypothetical protein
MALLAGVMLLNRTSLVSLARLLLIRCSRIYLYSRTVNQFALLGHPMLGSCIDPTVLRSIVRLDFRQQQNLRKPIYPSCLERNGDMSLKK